MSGLIVIGTFFAMLAVVGVNDGWVKPLKIFGSYIISVMILNLLAKMFNFTLDIVTVLRILLMGGFTVSLLLYCFTKGYIKKF